MNSIYGWIVVFWVEDLFDFKLNLCFFLFIEKKVNNKLGVRECGEL